MVATDPYPKRSIRDRSLNRQTFGYTYDRIPYIERLVLPTLFTKYDSFALRCYCWTSNRPACSKIEGGFKSQSIEIY